MGLEPRKLKRILELKKRIEQAKKGEVVSARTELDEAQLKLLHAQSEQNMRLSELQNAAEVSATELADRARFVVLAGQQVGVARTYVAQKDKEFLAREEARMLATRDVRTFEILNEKARDELRTSQRKAEQSAADEVASTRWSKA